MNPDQPKKFETVYFYLAFSSFSLGIAIQTGLTMSFLLVQIIAALSARRSLGTLVVRGRRSGFAFLLAMITAAVVAQFKFDTNSAELQWALLAYWSVTAALINGVRWEWVHRALLIASVPGLLYSLYWLLRPEEIAWALERGFHMYPRAAGFLSNAITNAEGLAVLGCWSLARLSAGLEAKLGRGERRWIYIHLALSILVVVFSRVRAGIVGFTVLLLLHALAKPQYRRFALAAWLTMAVLFASGIAIFGFNTASIQERLDLMGHSVQLLAENPWFGIGPERFEEHLMGDRQGGHPHNTLLAVAVETGLLGLLAYLSLMAALIGQLWRLWRAYPEGDPLHWPVQSLCYAFALYWTFGFFDYNFGDTELQILHCFHWGLITQLWLALRQRAGEAT